jgi:hypothetical protein
VFIFVKIIEVCLFMLSRRRKESSYNRRKKGTREIHQQGTSHRLNII